MWYGSPIVERVFIRGRAVGVGRELTENVEGYYELSTIVAPPGRSESVAFKLSGIGPDQISEPGSRKTLHVVLLET